MSLVLSAVCAFLHARQADNPELPSYSAREYMMKQYDRIYGMNPAALSWWDYDLWSVVGASAEYENGSLHHPLTYDRMVKGRVATESILRLPKGKWTFHGRFIYENGSVDSVRANLSYRLRDNGSPSFYYCRKAGVRWNLQKYGLEAAASRQFGERWSAGGMIEYTGDLAFRKSDTRNAQTTLNIHVILSGSFRITSGNMLSIGADFLRVKEKPSFSRVYSSGADYNTYLMNGLGTYIQNLESDVSWRDIAPGGFIQWMQRSDRNRASVTYKFSSGNDRWMNNASQNENSQPVWTKYAYMKHSLLFTETVYFGNSLLDIRGDGGYVTGHGHSWNRTAGVYIQNYDYAGMTAGLELEWRHSRSAVRQVGAGASYISESRRDKSYDYRFSDSSVGAEVSLQLGFMAGKTVLTADLCGAYRHSLGVRHEPNAAVETNNEYTRYVGAPLAGWLGTDYAETGIKFNADIPVKKVLFGIGLGADYSFPAGKAAGVYRNTDFIGGRLLLNVYF